MNREEMIEFLKENLVIEADINSGYSDNSFEGYVKLYVRDGDQSVEISSAHIYFSVDGCRCE